MFYMLSLKEHIKTVIAFPLANSRITGALIRDTSRDIAKKKKAFAILQTLFIKSEKITNFKDFASYHDRYSNNSSDL